jgi:fructokinase
MPWPTPEEIPGPPCWCGRSGCLETFLSGLALAADHYRRTRRTQSAPEIAEAAAAGDPECCATLERYMDRLARGLASVINVVDPDAIVLGGGLSRISALYEQVPRLWIRHIFSDRVATPLFPPLHGASSGVRGAAWLWPPEEAP